MSTSMTPTVYADSAYRSTDIPIQPPHKWRQDANRSSLTRVPLHWGHYANLEPWKDVDAQLKPNQAGFLDNKKEDDLYINQKRWNFDNTAKWLILHPFLKFNSIVVIPWLMWIATVAKSSSSPIITAFIAFAMTGLSLWLIGKEKPSIKYYLIQTGIGFSIGLTTSILEYQSSHDADYLWACFGMAFSVFMGLIGWDYLLDLYLRVFKHDGSGFNRQTGMLTIGRRFRKPFIAPFYEFDVTAQYRPGPHGSGGYAIWLHHRYTTQEVFLGAKLHSLDFSLNEAMAFWDTLQRYMDVTQPLPDLPILEQFRHLDPTTAAHDWEQQRNPRHWRDMDRQDWDNQGREELIRRTREYKWQTQPCILQARIDPQLSIEAYYRGQEAKGIQATPQAEDFTFSRC
jgi:hypothetical protein